MSVMDERELDSARRERRRCFVWARAAAAVGAIATGAGFALGGGRSGDVATGLGVLAGVGLVALIGGALMAWLYRPSATGWMAEAGHGKRERLQSQRSVQLILFPVVGLIFLILAVGPTRDVLAGAGGLRNYLAILLPVLYAWVSASIAMGWDGRSRKYRRYLEDELTVALRARAITAAFAVLMAGATLAVGLSLVRIEFGVLGLMAALTATGATAGVRFAWLDREAGRDG